MSDPERLFDSYGVDPEVRELVQSLRELSPEAGAGTNSWGRMAVKIAAVPVLATASSSAAQLAPAAKVGTLGAGLSKALSLKIVLGALTSTALGVGLYSLHQQHVDATASERPPSAVVAPGRTAPLRVEPTKEEDSPAPPPVAEKLENTPMLPAPSTRRSALDAEASMLAKVRTELRGGDAHGALSTLNQLQSAFPHGQLTQERDVLSIEVLVANGNTAAARRKARSFIAAHPKSPHSARLERFAGAP